MPRFAVAPPTGATVATLLRGAWRDDPGLPALPRASLAGALRRSEAILLGTGCGALVWRRLAKTEHAASDAAVPYRDAFRYQAARAAAERLALAAAVRTVREAGADPLLVKGWATGRHYPEDALRPPGDVDLVVDRRLRASVERLLLDRRRASGELALAPIDLHDSLDDLADRPVPELLERATSVSIDDPAGTRVLVLGAEDHLRLLALHLLRHGAWRPLWLCDVAVLVERLGPSLDWDLCLRGRREDARRVALVVGLARRLLGAVLPDPPPHSSAREVPRWLADATLRQWERSYQRYSDDGMLAAARAGRGVVGAARRRWPNAIEATVSVGAPFNGLPRFPFQLADVLRRTGRALIAAR